ncbi:FtsW/RodA/SpoVE family cell cycle protein, partial [bacterium]|nr:FtsW/RodA/SpoVE family cell cycle protein [bacterium]
ILVKFLLVAVIALFALRILARSLQGLRGVFSFSRRKEISVVLWIFIIAFSTLLAYQSYWQVFIHNDYFEQTRELHDPRPWIAEATTMKGKIYDRHKDDLKLLATYRPASNGTLPRRTYPLGEATSHLIGYSDVERGKAGLEKFYFERLMGLTRDNEKEESNFINNRYFRLNPIGNDIVLTLDYELQKTAYDAFGDNKGAVVAIEPSTGDILVLVSAPSFHPDSVSVDDAWVRIVQDEENQRLYNRALKGRYPPGSTFKAVVASAAIEKGLNPVWTIGANGYLPPGVRRKRVYDHERASRARRGLVWRGHGVTNMTKAMVKSSNAYFARLGVTVGDSMMHEITDRFGYNQPVAWNISRASLLEGMVAFRSSFPPTKNAHELAWSSIGQQEVLATPLQLALTAAAIANDGVLMKPKIELDEPPEVWRRVMSEETARAVRALMREVVWSRGGTAWRLRMKEVEAAGKTGTSEITKIITRRDGSSRKIIVNNALFISFAPVNDPKIAIAVVAEGAGYGGAAAAPIAKEVYLKAYELGYFKTESGEQLTKNDNPLLGLTGAVLISLIGLLSVFVAGNAKGYEPSLAVLLRNVLLMTAFPALYLLLKRQYKGDFSILVVVALLTGLGFIVQYRISSAINVDFQATLVRQFSAAKQSQMDALERPDDTAPVATAMKRTSQQRTLESIQQEGKELLKLDEFKWSRLLQDFFDGIPGWTRLIGSYLVALLSILFIIRRCSDDRFIDSLSHPFFWVALTVVLLVVFVGLSEVKTRGRFVYQMTPWEAFKITIIIFLAGFFTKYQSEFTRHTPQIKGKRLQRFLLLGGLFILIWLVPQVLFVLLKDFGQVILYSGLVVIMIFVTTRRYAYLIGGIAATVLASKSILLLESMVPAHVLQRFVIWSDLWALPHDNAWWDNGYQIMNSFFALNAGGWTGAGLGLGYPTNIPLVVSDFVYSAIAEELGLIGTAVILLLYVGLFFLGLRIAVESDNDFERLLAVGFTAILAIQVFVNIGGVIKLIPLTGITLPFISRGGFSLLISFVIVGFLMGLSHRNGMRASIA